MNEKKHSHIRALLSMALQNLSDMQAQAKNLEDLGISRDPSHNNAYASSLGLLTKNVGDLANLIGVPANLIGISTGSGGDNPQKQFLSASGKRLPFQVAATKRDEFTRVM